MNTQSNLRSRVDALWAHVEQHHAPDIPELNATLRAIDDAEIDGNLTGARLSRIEKSIHARRRSYAVEHATGRTPGYVHEDRDGTPRPSKPLHGDKHIDRLKSRQWRVRVSTNGETVTSLHPTKREAQMERDYLLEYRATEKQVRSIYRADSEDRVAKDAGIIMDARAAAAERKAALREALRANPGTPWSAILRRPEFDTTGEPPKVDPRPRKTA